VLLAMVPGTRLVLLRGPGLREEFRNATCGNNFSAKDNIMRAETQNLVEEIKQSVRLLRRHL
jgi:hypothetical protein